MTLKRYAVFAGAAYYPMGGWDDLILLTDEYEEALATIAPYEGSYYRWAHVVDLHTQKPVGSS